MITSPIPSSIGTPEELEELSEEEKGEKVRTMNTELFTFTIFAESTKNIPKFPS
jgi:hypothetical protein